MQNSVERYLDKRNKFITNLLVIIGNRKIEGAVRFQTHNGKSTLYKDFHILCTTLCRLYDDIEPMWRDNIIGIEEVESSDGEHKEYRFVLDKKGEKTYRSIEELRFLKKT